MQRNCGTNMSEHTPGVTYDGQRRLFRLRCKTSLYAFRVDDARNLEHLYWGPSLPQADDITYLIRSHVATPFDPKGSVAVSFAKVLGICDTLSDKRKPSNRTPEQRTSSWEHIKRNRRLENASWRLWHQNRNELPPSSTSSSSLTADILPQEAALHNRAFPPANQLPPLFNEPPSTSTNPLTRSHSRPRDLVNPSQQIRSRTNSTSLLSALTDLNTVHSSTDIEAAAGDGGRNRIPSSSNIHALSSTQPNQSPSFPTSRSFNFNLNNASYTDLSVQDQDTNWGALDPEVLGKNTKLLEFSDQGTGDYREPSFKVTFASDGSSVCPIHYKGHRIVEGKVPMPSPLPAMYTDRLEEATTLIVEMEDSLYSLRFSLYYTVMHDYDIITRRTVVVNDGRHPVTLRHVSSGTFDFDAEGDFFMTQLAGGWARERHVITQKLEYGVKEIKSTRGASSHQFNPFIIISPTGEPVEDSGDCFGFALVYSGNFSTKCEVTEYGRLRVNMGINPDGFIWYLDNKEGKNTYCTPEVVMSYSNEGLGGLSRTLHRAFRERLLPRNWRYKIPPVLINTWEAAYFDVSHEIVVDIAQAARKANIELLVLDDGWFGQRDNTLSGLGDWFPNSKKFPFGVDGIARAVNDIGLKFGIWVEPEMVSIDSDLYRKHSDWCLCVPTRSRTTGRNQLVLDFSREVVRDHIYKQLFKLFTSANIEYVKWDMNRHLTEVFSQEWHAERQGEVSHRFILGLYELLGRLTETFPNILFETCSGGGGRFDAGMLYFAPQIWTSDNTDAISRVSIQYGTSLAYPAMCMGAHVSAVPNHQTLRTTPMKTRTVVALSGTFGYELDPREFTEEDIAEVRGYIDLQKNLAPLVYEGDMYRLWSPFKSSSAAWMFVSRDKKRGVVIAVNIRRIVGRLLPRLKLQGLVDDTCYRVDELCPGTVVRNADTGAIEHTQLGVSQYGEPLMISGYTLRNAGLPIKFMFDSDSVLLELNACINEVVPATNEDSNGTGITNDDVTENDGCSNRHVLNQIDE